LAEDELRVGQRSNMSADGRKGGGSTDGGCGAEWLARSERLVVELATKVGVGGDWLECRGSDYPLPRSWRMLLWVGTAAGKQPLPR
jgi:hypothetical protein